MEWSLVRVLGAALLCVAPWGVSAAEGDPCLGGGSGTPGNQLSDPAAQFLCSKACNGPCGAWLFPERAALIEEMAARGRHGEEPGPAPWDQEAGNNEVENEVVDEVVGNDDDGEPLRRSLGYAVGHFRWGKPANRKKRPVKVFVDPGSEDYQELSERAIVSQSDLQQHQHEDHHRLQQQQHRHLEQNALTLAQLSGGLSSSAFWPWVVSPGAASMAGAGMSGPIWSQEQVGPGSRRQNKRYGGFQVHSAPAAAKTPLMVLFKMFKGRDGKSQ